MTQLTPEEARQTMRDRMQGRPFAEWVFLGMLEMDGVSPEDFLSETLTLMERHHHERNTIKTRT